MELKQRRLIYRVVQLGLIAIVVALVATWVLRRMSGPVEVTMQTEAPAIETLGPGDLQIFNADSTVDLILKDDKIYAGLSPQTIARVREKLARSGDRDTSGLGAGIAQFVKQQVAEKIGTRAVYDINDMRDMRYDDGRILIEWRRGGEDQLLGNVKVDDNRASNRFRREDAERLIAAVKERQRSAR